MKKINNYLIYIIILVSICFAIKDFNLAKYDRLIGDLSIGLVLLLPKIIKKILNIKIKDELYFVYIIFIFLAQFIGCVVNLYNLTGWYDLFVHFVSGALVAIFSFIVLNWFNIFNKKNKLFNVVFILAFSSLIAMLWEFGEFSFDNLLGLNVQHSIETGVKDTMEDMLIAFLGSIIISTLYISKKNKYLFKVIDKIK